MLDPFAMYTAFPCSDYYGSSAPPRQHRSTTDLPADRLAAGREGDHRGGSHVHSEPVDGVGVQLCPCNLATPTPQTFDVASRPATSTSRRVTPPTAETIAEVCVATQPGSVRLELVVLS